VAWCPVTPRNSDILVSSSEILPVLNDATELIDMHVHRGLCALGVSYSVKTTIFSGTKYQLPSHFNEDSPFATVGRLVVNLSLPFPKSYPHKSPLLHGQIDL